MFTRVVVFGDSFAYDPGVDYAWTRQVARYFNVPLTNIAEAGSSLQHGMVRLMDYVSMPPFQKTDLIIYAVTSGRRSPWAPPPISATLVQYFAGILPKDTEAYKYYREHEEFYGRYLDLYRPDLDELYKMSILSMLRSLDVFTVALTCWPLLQELKQPQRNGVRDAWGADNLFESSPNYVFVKEPLYQLSMSEMIPEHQAHVEKNGWRDQRPNHFSPENHNALAEQIILCIENGYDVFKKEEFRRHFFDPFNQPIFDPKLLS